MPEIQTTLAIRLSEIELRISIGILVELKNNYVDIEYHVLRSDRNRIFANIPPTHAQQTTAILVTACAMRVSAHLSGHR